MFAHNTPTFDLIRTSPRPPPPPPLLNYTNWCSFLDQLRISMTASGWRSRVEKLISESNGGCFLLLTFFDRTPVSREIDCWSLAKISEILAGTDILPMPMPIFSDIPAWRASTNRQGQCWRKSFDNSWPAICSQSLGDCIRWRVPFKRRVPARSGRSQLLQTLPGRNSKKMLTRLVHNLCMHLYFVNANILLTPNFCRRQYFVDDYIL